MLIFPVCLEILLLMTDIKFSLENLRLGQNNFFLYPATLINKDKQPSGQKGVKKRLKSVSDCFKQNSKRFPNILTIDFRFPLRFRCDRIVYI